MAALVQDEQIAQAYALLAPVLAERTPFRLLDRIGEAVGTAPLEAVNAFLDRIVVARTETQTPTKRSSRRYGSPQAFSIPSSLE